MSIARRKPQSYFTGLLETLNILIEFFYGSSGGAGPQQQPQDETLLKMKRQLQLYASDSSELISKYLSERYRKQKEVQPGEFVDGSITVRCQILREHLRIEILNARHLKPPDPIASKSYFSCPSYFQPTKSPCQIRVSHGTQFFRSN